MIIVAMLADRITVLRACALFIAGTGNAWFALGFRNALKRAVGNQPLAVMETVQTHVAFSMQLRVAP